MISFCNSDASNLCGMIIRCLVVRRTSKESPDYVFEMSKKRYKWRAQNPSTPKKLLALIMDKDANVVMYYCISLYLYLMPNTLENIRIFSSLTMKQMYTLRRYVYIKNSKN